MNVFTTFLLEHFTEFINAPASWKILHSVLSCRLIWQSWQSSCNWFYQGNPFLPPTV